MPRFDVTEKLSKLRVAPPRENMSCSLPGLAPALRASVVLLCSTIGPCRQELALYTTRCKNTGLWPHESAFGHRYRCCLWICHQILSVDAAAMPEVALLFFFVFLFFKSNLAHEYMKVC